MSEGELPDSNESAAEEPHSDSESQEDASWELGHLIDTFSDKVKEVLGYIRPDFCIGPIPVGAVCQALSLFVSGVRLIANKTISVIRFLNEKANSFPLETTSKALESVSPKLAKFFRGCFTAAKSVINTVAAVCDDVRKVKDLAQQAVRKLQNVFRKTKSFLYRILGVEQLEENPEIAELGVALEEDIVEHEEELAGLVVQEEEEEEELEEVEETDEIRAEALEEAREVVTS